MKTTTKAIMKALHGRFSGAKDDKGYTLSPQENLLADINWAMVEEDLRRGDGGELRMKFEAIHSSAALAVNCFGPFKDHPESLRLLDKQGAKRVEFERRFPIFSEVGAPNIDVWIDRGQHAVAVESKLLEYFNPPKKAQFSTAYGQLAPPESDPAWWSAYERAKAGGPQRLDRGQLVKHYFGLNEFRKQNPEGPVPTLLYIFWEPLNWQDVEECRQHRGEVKDLEDSLSNSQIPFRWKSYNDLWGEWRAVPELEAHTQQLMARYQVRLQA